MSSGSSPIDIDRLTNMFRWKGGFGAGARCRRWRIDIFALSYCRRVRQFITSSLIEISFHEGPIL